MVCWNWTPKYNPFNIDEENWGTLDLENRKYDVKEDNTSWLPSAYDFSSRNVEKCSLDKQSKRIYTEQKIRFQDAFYLEFDDNSALTLQFKLKLNGSYLFYSDTRYDCPFQLLLK